MIDILLATYNGEKFLDSQIASIVNQTYQDWILYIRDDGSSDNTQNIIKRWTLLDDRIKIVDDKKGNMGIGENFLYLLKHSTAEYVCFCDQDDYWFENKLNVLYDTIKDKPLNIPILIIHKIVNWMYPLNILENVTSKKIKTLENFLFLNGGFQGCASIFNVKLKEYLLSIRGDIWMHDHYMSLIALTFGEVFYDNHVLILYRQHTDNASVRIITNKLSLLLTELIKNRNIPVVYQPSYKDTDNFFKIFEEQLDPFKKKILQNYLFSPNMSFLKRFFFILFSRFSLGNFGHFRLVTKLLLRKTFFNSQ
jgi:rhamnosyltransferase